MKNKKGWPKEDSIPKTNKTCKRNNQLSIDARQNKELPHYTRPFTISKYSSKKSIQPWKLILILVQEQLCSVKEEHRTSVNLLSIWLLRWFQRGWLKLDEDLNFSEKVQNKSIEWRSKKTIDRLVFTVINREVGGKCIGSHESLKKWPTICWIMIFYVWFRLDEEEKKTHLR